MRRAEDQFKFVHDRATKGQGSGKKKYLFGALIGLVSGEWSALSVASYYKMTLPVIVAMLTFIKYRM